MHWLTLLLAEDPPAAAPSLFSGPFIPIIIAFVVFMIFTTRANARQRKEQQLRLAKAKKNDKVITSAGIIGIIVAVKENEDEVTLRVDETTNSRIRVLKSSIAQIITEEQQQQQQTAQTTENKTT